jgi:hypothetical protein
MVYTAINYKVVAAGLVGVLTLSFIHLASTVIKKPKSSKQAAYVQVNGIDRKDSGL